MPRDFPFDFVDMRLFQNVAESSSLSRGAERSNLSLGAASMRIKNLEVSLGVDLLNRTGRGVTLTSAGETFLQHACFTIQRLGLLENELKQYSRGLKGRLRVAANLTSVVERVPTAMRSYLATHPGVEVELKQLRSELGLRAVSKGAVDVALVAGPVADETLTVVPLGEEQFVLITAPTHPLGDERSISFSRMLDHELIGLGDAKSKHYLFSRLAGELGKPLKFRMHVNNYEGVCRLVASGMGVSPIPAQVARRYAPRISFRQIPFGEAWACRQISVCHRRTPPLPRFVAEFVEVLRAGAFPEQVETT